MILFAFLLPVLLGFTGLAVDLARALVIKQEMQSATEAAALQGARTLVSLNGVYPDWAEAEAETLRSLQLNTLREGWNVSTTNNAVAGWWNITSANGLTAGGSAPPLGYPYAPAVRLNMSLGAEDGSGLLEFPFASLIGAAPASIRVSATALLRPPGAAGPSSLYPVFLDQCVYNDTTITTIVIGKNTAGGDIFYPDSSQSSCSPGRWTRFDTVAPTTQQFAPGTNLQQLAVTDLIYPNNFLSTNVRVTSGLPKRVSVPVVNGDNQIMGFGALEIIGARPSTITYGTKPAEVPATATRWVAARVLRGTFMPAGPTETNGLTLGAGDGKNFGGFLPPLLAL